MIYRLEESALSENERQVWDILKGRLGLANAITSARIEEMTGINRFQCCKIVQTLRLTHKIPVVANKYGGTKGYFLPQTKAELKETIREFVRQAEVMLAVVDVLNDAPVL